MINAMNRGFRIGLGASLALYFLALVLWQAKDSSGCLVATVVCVAALAGLVITNFMRHRGEPQKPV